MPSTTSTWMIGLLLGLIFFFTVDSTLAQRRSAEPDLRRAETPTNLFASFDFDREASGVEVSLPDGWTLQDAVLLHYGSERIPVSVASSSGSTYRLRTERMVRGPHHVVLRVVPSARTGRVSWRVAPLRTDEFGRLRVDRDAAVSRRILVRPAQDAVTSNRVLQFASGAPPLVLRPDAVPPLSGAATFTVEAWMRTTGLDEVLLSTWTGDEQQPYPLEVVVDPSGSLRAYTGRPGRHSALTTPTPIADGEWHHVAVSFDGRQLRLVLDGGVADSLAAASLPAPLGPAALAVGGRLPSARTPADTARFTGQIDEVRVWTGARSVRDVRATMREPLEVDPERVKDAGSGRTGQAQDGTAALVLHLGFDRERSAGDARGDETSSDDRFVRQWPDGADRVASTLLLEPGLQDFRAAPDDGTVRLTWSAPAAQVDAYVVQRSTDGETFTTFRRIRPPASGAGRASFDVTDTGASSQVVYYRIRQVYRDGTTRTSGTLKVGLGTPEDDGGAVQLIGNFPNPFTSTTTIAYQIDGEPVPIQISVWDLTGQRIAQVVDEVRGTGYHEHRFDGSTLPSGPYFLRLKTPSETQSHRMIILR